MLRSPRTCGRLGWHHLPGRLRAEAGWGSRRAAAYPRTFHAMGWLMAKCESGLLLFPHAQPRSIGRTRLLYGLFVKPLASRVARTAICLSFLILRRQTSSPIRAVSRPWVPLTADRRVHPGVTTPFLNHGACWIHKFRLSSPACR